jgi:hypothetical protein
MNKSFLVTIVASASVGLLIPTGSAYAQNCRAKKTVKECMACVQKSGHAGSSGGYDYCTGKTNKSGKEERK